MLDEGHKFISHWLLRAILVKTKAFIYFIFIYITFWRCDYTGSPYLLTLSYFNTLNVDLEIEQRSLAQPTEPMVESLKYTFSLVSQELTGFYNMHS
jgi:hypothetical protein